MTDPYFDEVHGDAFLSLVLGGIARAGQRHRAKLQTVDKNGNPISDGSWIDSEANQGGTAT